jgi:phosphoribosyl-ATP pyrophosphohydrolase
MRNRKLHKFIIITMIVPLEHNAVSSYTAKLLASGWARIAQKVGEEGIETALTGAGGRDEEVIEEVADLLYHVMVMLKARGLTLERVIGELRARHTAPLIRTPGSTNDPLASRKTT